MINNSPHHRKRSYDDHHQGQHNLLIPELEGPPKFVRNPKCVIGFGQEYLAAEIFLSIPELPDDVDHEAFEPQEQQVHQSPVSVLGSKRLCTAVPLPKTRLSMRRTTFVDAIPSAMTASYHQEPPIFPSELSFACTPTPSASMDQELSIPLPRHKLLPRSDARRRP